MKKTLISLILLLVVSTLVIAQPKATAPSEPVQKAKSLQKQLKLNDDQTSKIGTIYTESAAKFDEIKKKDNGETNEMLVDVAPLRKATIAKIKTLLNKQQAAEFDQLIKESKSSSLNGGWSDGWN